jgi:hypothetical protein
MGIAANEPSQSHNIRVYKLAQALKQATAHVSGMTTLRKNSLSKRHVVNVLNASFN